MATHPIHHLELMIDQYQPHSKIDLINQRLTDADMNMVVQHAIINKQCEKLLLSENMITSTGSSTIAKALKNNNNLKFLSLSYNHLGDEGVQSLTKILSLNNCKLETLSLHATAITDTSAKYLSEMLKKNTTLTWLHLGKNKISDQGVRLLANVLTDDNVTLKVLALSQNESISDLSIDYLSEMFKQNNSLETLWLNDCKLSDKGKEKLKQIVQSKKRFFVLSV